MHEADTWLRALLSVETTSIRAGRAAFSSAHLARRLSAAARRPSTSCIRSSAGGGDQLADRR